MTDNYKKALDLINELSELVADLQKFSDYENRGGYVYSDTKVSYFEIGLEHLSIPPYSLKSRLLSGEDITPTQIVEVFLESRPKYSHIPFKFSEKELEQLVKEVGRDFWYNYHKVQGQAKLVRKQLEAINEEARYTVVNVKLVDSLLKNSKEFYESSRCW